MILKTKSFAIRQYTPDDVDNLAKYFSHPQVLRPVLGKTKKYGPADARQYILKKLRQYQRKSLRSAPGTESRGYAITKNGHLIGGLGFTDFGETAEIGYWLAKPYWGQGIMSRVVGKFVLYLRKKYRYKRIQAKVFPFNQASIKVLRKNHFQFDVRLVNSHKIGKGKFLDDLVYVKTFR